MDEKDSDKILTPFKKINYCCKNVSSILILKIYQIKKNKRNLIPTYLFQFIVLNVTFIIACKNHKNFIQNQCEAIPSNF